MLNRRQLLALSGALAATGTLAACGGDSKSGSGGDKKELTIGYLPAWTDGLSTAYLLDNLLSEKGYKVNHQELNDAGVLYTGLAKGDIDLYASAWPEVTHKSYMEKFGDKIEDLGSYYDNAKLTIAVPEYTDVTSIEELKDQADRFGKVMYGIEPGAGLTEATQDRVFPEYGLEDAGWELKTSSTPAMLSELEKATKAKKDIVVTLWRPFWANSAYPVKDLKDPKGSLGESEALHWLGREGFKEELGEVAELLGKLKFSDEVYNDLEDKVVNEYGEGKEEEAVKAFLKDNPDAVPSSK